MRVHSMPKSSNWSLDNEFGEGGPSLASIWESPSFAFCLIKVPGRTMMGKWSWC